MPPYPVLVLPPIETRLADEILLHPDLMATVPQWFKDYASEHGVKVRAFWAVPRFKILGTGKGADLLKPFVFDQFDADIRIAMAENHRFLELLRPTDYSHDHPSIHQDISLWLRSQSWTSVDALLSPRLSL